MAKDKDGVERCDRIDCADPGEPERCVGCGAKKSDEVPCTAAIGGGHVWKHLPGRGKWRPVLLFRSSRTHTGPPQRVQVGVSLCDKHRDVRAELYLTDDFFERLCVGFKAHGKPAPHRPSTRVEFIALESTEAKAHDEAFAKGDTD